MLDSPKYRVVPILMALIAVVGLGACGSSSNSAPPTTTLPPAEAWATQVCGALGTWTTGMSAMSSGPPTSTSDIVQGLEEQMQQAIDLTKQLTDSLKAAGPPQTQSGQQIKTQLDSLSTSIDERVTALKAEVDGLQSVGSLSDLSQSVSTIVSNLQGIVTDTRDAIAQLEGVDPSGELKAAIDATPACQQFTKGSTGTTTKAG